MKRGILLIFVLIFTSISSLLYCDSLKMQDGKIFKGIIIDYENGKYGLKINSKKYYINEASIMQIYWQATQTELDTAFKDEVFKASSIVRDTPKFVIKLIADHLIPMTPVIASVFKSGFNNAGAEIGFEYSTYSGMLSVFTGGGEGTVSFIDPKDNLEHKTKQKSSVLGIFLGPQYRYFPKSFVSPVIGVNIGFQWITDELDAYPMGWGDYSVYGSYIPGYVSVPYIKVIKSGASAAGKITAGADININEHLKIDIRGGYFACSRESFTDVNKFTSENSIFEGAVFSQYIYISAGIRYIF
jgi:hypothetical protein